MNSSLLLYTLAIIWNLVAWSAHFSSADAATAADKPSTTSNQGGLTSFYPFAKLFNGRQSTDSSTIANLVAGLLGLAATGRVAPLLLPLLVRFLVMPFMSVIRSLAKGMLFIGVSAFLVSSLVPALLAYMGLLGGAGFVGRAQQSSSWLVNPVNEFLQHRVATVADGALTYLDMNSTQCKLMLSCKMGRFMVDEYPTFTGYMRRFGITSLVQTTAGHYTSALLDGMLGEEGQDEDGDDHCGSKKCPSYRSLEGYIYSASDMGKLVQMTSTTSTTSTTTTPSPVPTTESQSANEVNNNGHESNVIAVLQELSKNYYDIGQWRNLTSYLY